MVSNAHRKPGIRYLPVVTRELTGLTFLICTLNVAALEDNQAMHEWYNHYYQHHDRQLVVPALEYFYSAKKPASGLQQRSRLGFFSALFKQHPQRVHTWLSGSRLSASERKPLIHAMATAGLVTEASSWAHQDHWTNADITGLGYLPLTLDPARLVITRDVDIGFLWGAFKASGDKRYLDKLMTSLLHELGSSQAPASESIIVTIIKTLHYHRSRDSVINEFYVTRYSVLNSKIQAELDILFADQAGEDGGLDCE